MNKLLISFLSYIWWLMHINHFSLLFWWLVLHWVDRSKLSAVSTALDHSCPLLPCKQFLTTYRWGCSITVGWLKDLESLWACSSSNYISFIRNISKSKRLPLLMTGLTFFKCFASNISEHSNKPYEREFFILQFADVATARLHSLFKDTIQVNLKLEMEPRND